MSQSPYAGPLVPPSTEFGEPTVTGTSTGADPKPAGEAAGTGNGSGTSNGSAHATHGHGQVGGSSGAATGSSTVSTSRGAALGTISAPTTSGGYGAGTATQTVPGAPAAPGAPSTSGAPAAPGASKAQPGKGEAAGGGRLRRPPRGPRRARLQLRHINPWTVLKFSCVLSVALFFVWLIVIGLLFGVLDATGVIGKINDAVTTINGPGSKNPVTPGIVFGGAALIGVINVLLFIALTTIGSVIYNLCADLVGGIELTLSEA